MSHLTYAESLVIGLIQGRLRRRRGRDGGGAYAGRPARADRAGWTAGADRTGGGDRTSAAGRPPAGRDRAGPGRASPARWSRSRSTVWRPAWAACATSRCA